MKASELCNEIKVKLKDFSTLNAFEKNEWLTGNFEISKVFVEIYNTHGSKKQFKKQLKLWLHIILVQF